MQNNPSSGGREEPRRLVRERPVEVGCGTVEARYREAAAGAEGRWGREKGDVVHGYY